MAEYEDTYKFDASQAIEEIKKLDAELRKHNRQLSQIKANLSENVEEYGNLSVKYEEILSNGRKVTALLRRTADGWETVRAAMVTVQGEMAQQIADEKKMAEGLRIRMRLQTLVNAADKRTDKEAEAGKAKGIAALNAELANIEKARKSRAAEINKLETDRLRVLENQAKITKTLAEAREKADDSAEAERRKEVLAEQLALYKKLEGEYDKLIAQQKEAMRIAQAERQVSKELSGVRKSILKQDSTTEAERRKGILAEQVALYKKLEAEYEKLTAQQKEAMRVAQAEKQVTTELAKVRKDMLKQDDAAEQEHRKEVLAKQAALYAKMADENKRLLQYDKERNLALTNQAKHTKAISEAGTKAADQARQQQRAARQAQAGQLLGTKLKGEFVDPFKALANPAQLARVQNQINAVVKLVEQGAIKASAAYKIITRAAAGDPQVLTGVANRVQNVGAALENSTKTILSNADKLTEGLSNVENQTNKNSKSIINLATAFRLFGIQLAHTAIRAFINELTQGIETSKAFAIRIGEIQTISQQSSLDFQNWATTTRKLSDEFGNPILDTAEGIYEAISNQIAKGADAAAFMGKAMQLARVAVSSTEDAVNTLSSVINGYNLSVTQTERISAILFKTVDLGRIRLSDMGSTLGRITPIASFLGISFEELSAGIATLTIKGITPSETLTALNGVMTKLLNPTKEMKELFASWGVASGQAAIATFGFEGVLRKVIEATQSGQSSFAELFNEIRATRGGLGLVSNDLKGYSKTLDDIREGSQKDFIEAQKIINKNVGIQFQVELNRIKNFFIDDFGAGIVRTILSWTTTFDESGKRISGFTEQLSVLVSLAKVAVGAFIAFKAVSIISGIRLGEFTTKVSEAWRSLGQFNGTLFQTATRWQKVQQTLGNPLVLTGITVAVSALILLYEDHNRKVQEVATAYKNMANDVEAAVIQQTKILSEQLNKQEEEFVKSLNKRMNLYNRFAAAYNIVTDKITDRQNKAIIAGGKAIENAFSIYLKTAQSGLSNLEALTSKSLSNIERMGEKIRALQDDLVQGRFKAELKSAPEDQQIEKIQQRIRDMDKAAQGFAQAAASATTSTDADAKTKEYEKRVEEGQKLQNELVERRAKTEQEITEGKERIAELEKRLAADAEIRNKRQDVREGAREQARKRAGRGQGATRLEGLQDELTAARSEEEVRRDTEQLEKEKEKLALNEKVKTQIGDLKSLEDSLAQSTQNTVDTLKLLTTAEEGRRKATEAAAEAERKRLETVKDTFAEIAKFELPKEITPQNFAEISKNIKDLFQKGIQEAPDPAVAVELTKQRNLLEVEAARRLEQTKQKLAQESASKRQAQIIEEQGQIRKAQEDLAKKQGTGIEGLRKSVDVFAKAFTAFPSAGAKAIAAQTLGIQGPSRNVTIEQVTQELNKRIDEVARLIAAGKPEDAAKAQLKLQQDFAKIVEGIAQERGLGGEVREFVVEPAPRKEDDLTLEKIILGFDAFSNQLRSIPEEQLKLAQKQVEAQKKLDALPNLTPAVDQANQGLKKLGEQANKLATDFLKIDFSKFHFTPLIPKEQNAQGSWSSAWARGTDRIPAMLSKGEFVVRESVASKYWKELMQLNSGRPLYRAEGGPVEQVTGMGNTPIQLNSGSNVNVGGINIALTPTGNTQVDAKALVGEINRMIRRGEVQWKP